VSLVILSGGVVRPFPPPRYFEQHNSLTIVIGTEKFIKLLKIPTETNKYNYKFVHILT